MTARILETIGLETKLPPGAEQRIDLLADLELRRRSPGLSRRGLAAIGDEYAALGCVRLANECYEAAGVAKRAQPPEPVKAVRKMRKLGPRPGTIPKLQTARWLIANGASQRAAAKAVGLSRGNIGKQLQKWARLLEAS